MDKFNIIVRLPEDSWFQELPDLEQMAIAYAVAYCENWKCGVPGHLYLTIIYKLVKYLESYQDVIDDLEDSLADAEDELQVWITGET